MLIAFVFLVLFLGVGAGESLVEEFEPVLVEAFELVEAVSSVA